MRTPAFRELVGRTGTQRQHATGTGADRVRVEVRRLAGRDPAAATRPASVRQTAAEHLARTVGAAPARRCDRDLHVVRRADVGAVIAPREPGCSHTGQGDRPREQRGDAACAARAGVPQCVRARVCARACVCALVHVCSRALRTRVCAVDYMLPLCSACCIVASSLSYHHTMSIHFECACDGCV